MAILSAAAVLDPAEDAQLRESVRDLVRTATIEASVKNIGEVDRYRECLAPGMAVYVTWLPGQPCTHMVSVAARLAASGYRPIPHITARRLPDVPAAQELIARLAGEAGVDEALVIAGDVDRPAGPYDSAASLLDSGLLQAHGIRRVGIAGYPEGHPRISAPRIEAELRLKLDICRVNGLEACIVSQFCFDGATILQWLARIRGAGIDAPVRVGLAGPASIRTLLNFGLRCGVGASMRALRRHGVSLTRLAAPRGPDEVVIDLAAAFHGRGAAPAYSLHFFSFGGVPRTAAWMSAIAGGRFVLDAGRREISVCS